MVDQPDDFVFENAPLVEVIAEVRWPLLKTMSGALDPGFDKAQATFLELSRNEGFGRRERIVPREIPLELTPHQPIYRVRTAANVWPLYQLGPGIFTANHVPPYPGWKAFLDVLRSGLILLHHAYEISGSGKQIENLMLRYVDAFTDAHGLSSYLEFIGDFLGFHLTLPKSLTDSFMIDGKLIDIDLGIRGATPAIENGQFVVTLSPGTKEGNRALIADISLSSVFGARQMSQEEILSWASGAHRVLRQFFLSTIETKLEPMLGQRKPI